MNKKLISAMTLFLGMMAYSQVTVGLRTNALINTSSASWENFKGTVNTAVDSKGDNATGFNVGLAFKVDFPVSGWFVMPEVYYTSFKNTVETTGDVELEAKSNRIDVPVLVGHNFLLGKLVIRFSFSFLSNINMLYINIIFLNVQSESTPSSISAGHIPPQTQLNLQVLHFSLGI